MRSLGLCELTIINPDILQQHYLTVVLKTLLLDITLPTFENISENIYVKALLMILDRCPMDIAQFQFSGVKMADACTKDVP